MFKEYFTWKELFENTTVLPWRQTCEFAGSVTLDLPKAGTGRAGLLSCLLSIGNCHRASWGRHECPDQESNWKDLEDSECLAGTDLNPGGYKAQILWLQRDMTCLKSNHSVATGKEQTGRIIQVHSLRSSARFPNRVRRNKDQIEQFKCQRFKQSWGSDMRSSQKK